MPKEKKNKQPQRHDPLHQQIVEQDPSRPVQKQEGKRQKEKGKQAEDEEYINLKTSRKILEHARDQMDEIDAEDGMPTNKPVDGTTGLFSSRLKNVDRKGKEPANDLDSDDSDNEGSHADIEAPEITDAEEEALKMFMGGRNDDADELTGLMGGDAGGGGGGMTIADLIMQKIAEKREENGLKAVKEEHRKRIGAKAEEVFKGVGQFLSHYKSGKLPKAFKVIPTLSNWEEALYITDPVNWTPHAVAAATKVFASNLNAKKAQRFYNSILLPAVREDILEHKKLNYHLYMALKKALFKPAAFYKGILIPLLESRTCTLRESTIIGSVLSKVSVPVLHSSATLLRLCDLDFHPATEMIIGLLVNKKYALPFRVVDSLVAHFMRAMGMNEELPVVWHQALLVFLQRYKNDIVGEAKEAIRSLLRKHRHHEITPECHRELDYSKDRVEQEKEDLMVM